MPPWGKISWIILYYQEKNEREKEEYWKYSSTQQFAYFVQMLMLIMEF